MNNDKAKDIKGSFRKLLSYLGSYKIAIVFVMVLAASSTVFSVVGPKIMGLATTELAEGILRKAAGTGGIEYDAVAKILLLTLALYLTSSVFSFFQGWMMTGITQKICYRMRKEISEKISRMPMKYFESRTHGEVLSRITNDVDTFGTGISDSITTILTSLTTLIGVFAMMLFISPLMTLLALLLLPICGILVSVTVLFSQKYFKTQQEYLGKINGQVEETYGGHLVIKAFHKEKEAVLKFNDTNRTLYESAWKSQFLSGLLHPVMGFAGNLGYVGVSVLGGLFALQGKIGVGDIQAFIQYTKSFMQPILQTAQIVGQVQSMLAAAERVFAFLEEEEESEWDTAGELPENILGNVSFCDVSFGYEKEHPVIRHFSAEAAAGQKVAIVGPTGAGKTTIVKLLMRFYDVDGGSIRIDGQDIRNFQRSRLREAFGMVLQDTWLFKGSIMENIRYGRPDATDEEVVAAAKAAYAHHFIETLPGGYEMELNEDASNVSQGQKQLLTIARAILADHKILILDEATSSVDTRTEVRIQKAMDNLMEGRTSFIIAHRLSTIRDADLILVMKDGDIVEQGSHSELLLRGGFYAELYNSQFEEAS